MYYQIKRNLAIVASTTDSVYVAWSFLCLMSTQHYQYDVAQVLWSSSLLDINFTTTIDYFWMNLWNSTGFWNSSAWTVSNINFNKDLWVKGRFLMRDVPGSMLQYPWSEVWLNDAVLCVPSLILMFSFEFLTTTHPFSINPPPQSQNMFSSSPLLEFHCLPSSSSQCHVRVYRWTSVAEIICSWKTKKTNPTTCMKREFVREKKECFPPVVSFWPNSKQHSQHNYIRHQDLRQP